MHALFSAFAFTDEIHHVHPGIDSRKSAYDTPSFHVKNAMEEGTRTLSTEKSWHCPPSCVLSVRTVIAAMLHHHHLTHPTTITYHPTNDHHDHYILKPRACHYFPPTIFDI
jgi:hypothetical protein